MKILLSIVALLGLGLPAVLVAGSWLSLDRDLEHTARTARLPLVGETPDAPLVRVRARGFEFRARVAGLDQSGPAVLMLHGFPESSIMYEPLLDAASAAGFRAAAFDQRGYSPGARPAPVAAYLTSELVADVLAVADALGFLRFHLVAHDWGSAVGWSLVDEHADRVQSYTSLSIPHTGGVSMARGDRGPPVYVRVFQVPVLIETLSTFWDLSLLRSAVYMTTPPHQVEEYTAILSEPGAMRAALNWYRAISPTELRPGEIHTPTLYVFGTQDMSVYVGERPRAEAARLMKGPYRSVALEAGHWLIQEERDAVVAEVMAHLAEYRDR